MNCTFQLVPVFTTYKVCCNYHLWDRIFTHYYDLFFRTCSEACLAYVDMGISRCYQTKDSPHPSHCINVSFALLPWHWVSSMFNCCWYSRKIVLWHCCFNLWPRTFHCTLAMFFRYSGVGFFPAFFRCLLKFDFWKLSLGLFLYVLPL